jgi:hypothetical protein
MFDERSGDDYEAVRNGMVRREATERSRFAADLFDGSIRGILESNYVAHSIVVCA